MKLYKTNQEFRDDLVSHLNSAKKSFIIVSDTLDNEIYGSREFTSTLKTKLEKGIKVAIVSGKYWRSENPKKHGLIDFLKDAQELFYTNLQVHITSKNIIPLNYWVVDMNRVLIQAPSRD